MGDTRSGVDGKGQQQNSLGNAGEEAVAEGRQEGGPQQEGVA